MEYEIVELKEKTVFGLSARTNNQAPDMGAVIGGVWERFFTQGIYEAIPDKCSGMPDVGRRQCTGRYGCDSYTCRKICKICGKRPYAP